MKNFDIEKLERRNIYSVPEKDFFAEMQNEVLKNVEQTAVVKPLFPKWIYSAAASMVLVTGFGWLIFNNHDTDASAVAEKSSYSVKSGMTKDVAVNYAHGTEVSTSKLDSPAAIAIPQSNELPQREASIIVDPIYHEEDENTYAETQPLTKVSPAEADDVTDGMEQDIYLELYN